MPNYCENNLVIMGEEKELKKFAKKAKDKKNALSIKKLVPMPKELEGTTAPPQKRNKELIKKYGADNWYDWCLKNWGTKWNPDIDTLEDETEGRLFCSFESAWSPPVEAFETISKMFPKLLFKLDFEETSMCFMGVATMKNGKKQEIYNEY